jgi:hypothetical protein
MPVDEGHLPRHALPCPRTCTGCGRHQGPCSLPAPPWCSSGTHCSSRRSALQGRIGREDGRFYTLPWPATQAARRRRRRRPARCPHVKQLWRRVHQHTMHSTHVRPNSCPPTHFRRCCLRPWRAPPAPVAAYGTGGGGQIVAQWCCSIQDRGLGGPGVGNAPVPQVPASYGFYSTLTSPWCAAYCWPP